MAYFDRPFSVSIRHRDNDDHDRKNALTTSTTVQLRSSGQIDANNSVLSSRKFSRSELGT